MSIHPPYTPFHLSPTQVIDALLECHQENPLSKFWGACNDQKYALDRCFRVRRSERKGGMEWKGGEYDPPVAMHGHVDMHACKGIVSCPRP